MFETRHKKQKWAADPRNETWARDKGKFGYRMLEQMGWSEGQGLGAQNQGSSSHVKAALKNNKLGVGADRKVDYEWLAVQDAYDSVLADLNVDLAEANGEGSQEEEEKPKAPRQGRASRMFYSRFKKGKDLNLYGKDDLAAILGHKSKRPQHLLENDSGNGSDENEAAQDQPEQSEQDGIVTVSAGESVGDYFARRLAEKRLALSGGVLQKDKKNKDKSAKRKAEDQEVDQQEQRQAKSARGDDDGSCDGTVAKKASKKKNKKRRVEGDQEAKATEADEGLEDTEKTSKKKKKGSKKDRKAATSEPEQPSADIANDDEGAAAAAAAAAKTEKKRSKKDKKRKLQEAPASMDQQQQPKAEEAAPQGENKKKKKKSKKQKGEASA